MLAKIFGKDADSEVDTELHRLKNLIEAGEIPTSSGQPTGRTEDKTAHISQNIWKQEEAMKASEQSFPASDAPAYSYRNGH
jgi:hypothetical protein